MAQNTAQKRSSEYRLRIALAQALSATSFARSRVLLLDSPAVTLVGHGQVDLGSEELNLGFDTETREPSLASLTVPFKVTGQLADPRVVPDPLGVAGNVAERIGGVAGTIPGLAESVGSVVTGGSAKAIVPTLLPPKDQPDDEPGQQRPTDTNQGVIQKCIANRRTDRGYLLLQGQEPLLDLVLF